MAEWLGDTPIFQQTMTDAERNEFERFKTPVKPAKANESKEDETMTTKKTAATKTATKKAAAKKTVEKKETNVDNKTNETLLAIITEACKNDEGLRDLVIAALAKNEVVEKTEEPKAEWYERFISDHTTVKVLSKTVQVKVERGFAKEWHDELRAAGFKWSRKGFWWASLDDEKRAAVAKRNQENDALTKGMTYEEKKAFWAARKAAKVA